MPIPTPRDDELIRTLNGLIKRLQPIKYHDFNLVIKGLDDSGDELEAYECECPKVGLRYFNDEGNEGPLCTSTLAIIATITDILIGKRLAFIVNDDEDRLITGVVWAPPR